MAATIYEDCNTFEKLSLEELRQQYEEAKKCLTATQIEQVENGNLSMIEQFPAMVTAHTVYLVLQRKQTEIRDRAVRGVQRIL